MTDIQARLFSMQDEGYRAFQSALIPTVDYARVIGVRIPELRAYAKELKGSDAAAAFMQELPHRYYEEDNLHAFLIEQLPTYEGTLEALDRFLPYVDNWATCDGMSPKCLGQRREDLYPKVMNWLAAAHPYTVRYGILCLMRHYLGESYRPACSQAVAAIKSDEYYVNMMVAWYFATALALRYEEILPYITEGRLSPWIHQKTIQKAVESRRLTPAQKEELRRYRHLLKKT